MNSVLEYSSKVRWPLFFEKRGVLLSINDPVGCADGQDVGDTIALWRDCCAAGEICSRRLKDLDAMRMNQLELKLVPRVDNLHAVAYGPPSVSEHRQPCV